LQSSFVYRLEIGAVFFLAAYAITVLVHLAWHGMTPSRVGTAAIDLPQLFDTVGLVNGDRDAAETSMDDMLYLLDEHRIRLDSVEQCLKEARDIS
jgi:hypothetical protein